MGNNPNENPTLSVVTICRNAASTISDTLASVLLQEADFEYVIIDGASTDATCDIITDQLRDRPHVLVSESDRGIADAMNKGVAHTSGDYILFLHADDRFIGKQSVQLAREAAASGEDLIAFDIVFKDGAHESRWPPRGWNWRMYLRTGLWHTGTLISRRLHDTIGLYDPDLRIAMDYDFFLRAYLAGASCKIVHEPLEVMSSGGLSSRQDPDSVMQKLSEERHIHDAHARSPLQRSAYGLYWLARRSYRKLVRGLPA